MSGDTFIGLKGENFDGNKFCEEALKKGAKICIIQDVILDKEILEEYKDRVIIKVKDTLKAIQQIAKYKRTLYDIPVVAITGSVGKTSTKDMIASVLSQKYNVLKTQGNFNNHIGLPLTILQLKDHTALVVEMGMNHFGEISLLTNIAKPDIAVITNIGTSHIGNLGSRENILKAKLEILEGLKENGSIIINNDNDLLHKWYEKNKKKYNIYTYGIDNISTIVAEDIKLFENGSKFICKIYEQKINIDVPVGGMHFIYNSLCAALVGYKLGLNNYEIIEGIKELKLTNKRMDIEKTEKGITILNDSYNSSYDSVKAVLEYISKTKNERKISVLGDMLELGEFSEELHRKVGNEVCKNNIDILVTVGKLSKFIADEAKKIGMNPKYIFSVDTNKEAIELLKKMMKKGDIVALKASNGMHFEEILKGIRT